MPFSALAVATRKFAWIAAAAVPATQMTALERVLFASDIHSYRYASFASLPRIVIAPSNPHQRFAAILLCVAR